MTENGAKCTLHANDENKSCKLVAYFERQEVMAFQTIAEAHHYFAEAVMKLINFICCIVQND